MNPFKRTNLLLTALAVIVLGGCAHSITIAPNPAAIVRNESAPPKVKANVGFFVPVEVSDIEVTTGGGGGDRVRYFPYRDIEAAYQKMLFNVFDNVTKLTSATDSAAIGRDNIKYIVTPVLITASGSTSPFTWPPTDFTVDLTSTVQDVQGGNVATKRSVGQGKAEFSEFSKLGTGLAGSRAMEDAVQKRFCRNSAMRSSIAARPRPIRKPASRTGSQQTRLAL